MNDTDKYSARGVSAAKEEVHAAVKNLDHGLYPTAFCKVYPDFLAGDDAFCNMMSSDGSGTKSILAYLYWKETGDLSVWKGIAQDVIVMNLDDLLCVGATNNFLFSSLINRNKHIIPGEVIKAIIEGTAEFFAQMKDFGIDVHFLGGETADLGDIARTATIDGTMTARIPKEELILTKNIQPGDVIVGLASYGQATYETEYNSGIGSNGLTSARHDILNKHYLDNYPETYDNATNPDVLYCGNYRLTDNMPGTDHEIGKMLLSPTRSFAPVLKAIIDEVGHQNIHGVIHCTGGGQTKVLHYIEGLKIIKDNLLPIPPIFDLIQKKSGTTWQEMYKVYNMGTRLEIYCDEAFAQKITDIARNFNINSHTIGRVESTLNSRVEILSADGCLMYSNDED